MENKLQAGVAVKDITPDKPLFLYGYPHVERISEGTHDPLYAAALVLDNGRHKIVMCAVDIIYITRQIVQNVRDVVAAETDILPQHIMISATHTHSGPMTVDSIYDDPSVPKADRAYISELCLSIASIIIQVYNNLIPSEIAITTANGEGIGGNRRHKDGAIDAEIPIILLRNVSTKQIFAVSTTYCMHPTVLHEDSRLYSADFPGYTREYLLNVLGKDVVYLYHTGPEGNQSPRHFISSNTFNEAKRLGYMLGERIINRIKLVSDNDFKDSPRLAIRTKNIMLPKKQFISPEQAETKLQNAIEKFERMRSGNASPKDIRTAECDWFGAEEMLTLSRKSRTGELDDIYDSVLPAEIQVIEIDNACFVCLPGELFVEYSLAIKERSTLRSFVICLANGILRGYIVTSEAYKNGGYEAWNSLFSPEAGEILVDQAIKLIETR